jgi:hypothetical protein
MIYPLCMPLAARTYSAWPTCEARLILHQVFCKRVRWIEMMKQNVLTSQFTLRCSVHRLPFMPVHLLARLVPGQTLIEILTFPQFDFAPSKETLVVE